MTFSRPETKPVGNVASRPPAASLTPQDLRFEELRLKNVCFNFQKFEKEITSKDKKGNPDSFKIILSLNSKISNQDGEEYSINFEESFIFFFSPIKKIALYFFNVSNFSLKGPAGSKYPLPIP